MKKKPVPPLIKDLASFGLTIGAAALALESKVPSTKVILEVNANRSTAILLKQIAIELGKILDKHYKR
jgi:hypothetical protein